MPAVGNLAGGYRDPMDEALAEVEAAIAKARELGAPRSIILGRVANGLTGAINGPRERLLTKALTRAADLLADVTQGTARILEETGGVVTVWDEASEERARAHAKHGDRSMESTPWHDPVGRPLDLGVVDFLGDLADLLEEDAEGAGRSTPSASVVSSCK